MNLNMNMNTMNTMNTMMDLSSLSSPPPPSSSTTTALPPPLFPIQEYIPVNVTYLNYINNLNMYLFEINRQMAKRLVQLENKEITTNTNTNDDDNNDDDNNDNNNNDDDNNDNDNNDNDNDNDDDNNDNNETKLILKPTIDVVMYDKTTGREYKTIRDRCQNIKENGEQCSNFRYMGDDCQFHCRLKASECQKSKLILNTRKRHCNIILKKLDNNNLQKRCRKKIYMEDLCFEHFEQKQKKRLREVKNKYADKNAIKNLLKLRHSGSSQKQKEQQQEEPQEEEQEPPRKVIFTSPRIIRGSSSSSSWSPSSSSPNSSSSSSSSSHLVSKNPISFRDNNLNLD